MKKKILLLITIILLIIGFILGYLYIDNQSKKREELIKEKEIQKKLSDIKSHYSENVITNKETVLYKKENNSYTKFGKINSEVLIKLNNENITVDTKYFYISDLNLYIGYEDVNPGEEHIKSDRYKNYIPFNENIKTKEITSFYNSDDKYIFTLNESFDFPIYIKDTDKYGVIYNEELLYVKSEDVESVYNNKNTYDKNKNRIKVLTYHYIYNQDISNCNQVICQSFNMFESHLDYIRKNDYFTLKLNELELYLDGKLQIPQKSIVITIDDGTLFDDGALELLEKYKVNATMFIITGRTNNFERFKSDYLDLESHTDNMHNAYECAGYGMQGGGILCLPEEQVLNDLKTSQEKLGGSKYFAYPFFDFNVRAIKLLKQAGFKLAFIGQYDTDGYSYPNVTDRYKVRRKTIFSDTSMDEFISYLQ